VEKVVAVLNSLFVVFHQSIKARTHLKRWATSQSLPLRLPLRVLGTRWAASTHRALLNVFFSYETIILFIRHGCDRKDKQYATLSALGKAMSTSGFLHDVASLLDVFEHLSLMSRVFQADDLTLYRANTELNNRLICLDWLGRSEGKFMKLVREGTAVDCSWGKVPLIQSTPKLPIQLLCDRVVASLKERFRDGLQLNHFDLLDPDDTGSWDTDVALGAWSQMACGGSSTDFCKEKLSLLLRLVAPSSADAERGFSNLKRAFMNRDNMSLSTSSQLLFIKANGPPPGAFDASKFCHLWLQAHREPKRGGSTSDSSKRRKIDDSAKLGCLMRDDFAKRACLMRLLNGDL
jgi:hypothetical protein